MVVVSLMVTGTTVVDDGPCTAFCCFQFWDDRKRCASALVRPILCDAIPSVRPYGCLSQENQRSHSASKDGEHWRKEVEANRTPRVNQASIVYSRLYIVLQAAVKWMDTIKSTKKTMQFVQNYYYWIQIRKDDLKIAYLQLT
jgi:Fe-S-cluster containining protein